MELAPGSTEPVLVEAMVVVDAGNNACRLMRFEVAEVVRLTCAQGNTFLEVGGSCSDMILGYRNMRVLMVECYCMESALKEREGRGWPVELEKESWVRSTRRQSCRTNGSCRSKLRIPGN